MSHCATSRLGNCCASPAIGSLRRYRRELERYPLWARRLQDRLCLVRPRFRGKPRSAGDPPRCISAARMEEIAASEDAMRHGHHAERPFVLLAQPSLFDSTRAPESRHVAWAYCHVPNGSTVDMLPRIEAQIERFAPGFRDCVLARRVFSPAELEAMDANLIGGDIGGGLADLRQFLFRPTEALRNLREGHLSLLVFHAARRRRARHVRLQCSQNGAQATVSDRARTRRRAARLRSRLSLTAVGGFVDAVGYIALFQVFTANMSGNSVHVGMYLGRAGLAKPVAAAMRHRVLHCGNDAHTHHGQIAGRSGIRRIASFTLAVEAVLLAVFRARHSRHAPRPDCRPAVAHLLHPGGAAGLRHGRADGDPHPRRRADHLHHVRHRDTDQADRILHSRAFLGLR